MLAIVALCGISLTGCTQAGNCAQAITPAPQISVDVSPWIKAHPETTVRVCVDGNCAAGENEVVVTGQDPKTPLRDGTVGQITVEPMRGSTVVESVTAQALLSADQCGQWSAHLQLSADGSLSTPPH